MGGWEGEFGGGLVVGVELSCAGIVGVASSKDWSSMLRGRTQDNAKTRRRTYSGGALIDVLLIALRVPQPVPFLFPRERHIQYESIIVEGHRT